MSEKLSRMDYVFVEQRHHQQQQMKQSVKTFAIFNETALEFHDYASIFLECWFLCSMFLCVGLNLSSHQQTQVFADWLLTLSQSLIFRLNKMILSEIVLSRVVFVYHTRFSLKMSLKWTSNGNRINYEDETKLSFLAFRWFHWNSSICANAMKFGDYWFSPTIFCGWLLFTHCIINLLMLCNAFSISIICTTATA